MQSSLALQSAIRVRRSSRHTGFTLIEMLTTVAVLIIIMGLMVSLARYVRRTSAEDLTRQILLRLDDAMAAYIRHNGGNLPVIVPFISGTAIPDEQSLQQTAQANNASFVRALRSTRDVMPASFGDLSIAYYDEITIRDSWGSPIVFMPAMHPAVGMSAKGWFFFSAGPDHRYLTRDDNLYSYETPPAEPPAK